MNLNYRLSKSGKALIVEHKHGKAVYAFLDAEFEAKAKKIMALVDRINKHEAVEDSEIAPLVLGDYDPEIGGYLKICHLIGRLALLLENAIENGAVASHMYSKDTNTREVKQWLKECAACEGYKLDRRELDALTRIYMVSYDYKTPTSYIYGRANNIKNYMEIY